MKVFMLAAMCFMLMTSVANAHTVFAPAGKNLKIHWAVLQSNPGMMPKIAEIGSRTVAKYTPNEPGTYSLYADLTKVIQTLCVFLKFMRTRKPTKFIRQLKASRRL